MEGNLFLVGFFFDVTMFLDFKFYTGQNLGVPKAPNKSIYNSNSKISCWQRGFHKFFMCTTHTCLYLTMFLINVAPSGFNGQRFIAKNIVTTEIN